MKNWLLTTVYLSLSIAVFAQAADRIAIVNMNSLFQRVAQKTGISMKLESEFKSRASELKRIEDNLQNKIQHLQHNGLTMKISERNKLEQDIMSQRQIFSQKTQIFDQDRQRRSNEEREKLINSIRTAVEKVAVIKNIDLVVDADVIAFNSNDVKDITDDVLKQVK